MRKSSTEHLRPACHIPTTEDVRAHAAGLMVRRGLATLAEIGCIALFLAMVWIWSAVGTGAL